MTDEEVNKWELIRDNSDCNNAIIEVNNKIKREFNKQKIVSNMIKNRKISELHSFLKDSLDILNKWHTYEFRPTFPDFAKSIRD